MYSVGLVVVVGFVDAVGLVDAGGLELGGFKLGGFDTGGLDADGLDADGLDANELFTSKHLFVGRFLTFLLTFSGNLFVLSRGLLSSIF